MKQFSWMPIPELGQDLWSGERYGSKFESDSGQCWFSTSFCVARCKMRRCYVCILRSSIYRDLPLVLFETPYSTSDQGSNRNVELRRNWWNTGRGLAMVCSPIQGVLPRVL